jgi:hypothetical protein
MLAGICYPNSADYSPAGGCFVSGSPHGSYSGKALIRIFVMYTTKREDRLSPVPPAQASEITGKSCRASNRSQRVEKVYGHRESCLIHACQRATPRLPGAPQTRLQAEAKTCAFSSQVAVIHKRYGGRWLAARNAHKERSL